MTSRGPFQPKLFIYFLISEVLYSGFKHLASGLIVVVIVNEVLLNIKLYYSESLITSSLTISYQILTDLPFKEKKHTNVYFKK